MEGNKQDSKEKIDFVVVYLKTVRQKVIVPERYINGYSNDFVKHLKNMGNNACRDHLIFWSNEIIEGEYYPDPDQNAEESLTFPPEKCGWYIGRTLYFTDNFEEAKNICDRKRKVIPPVYNPARLTEMPLPVLVLVPTEQHSEEVSDEIDPLDSSSTVPNNQSYSSSSNVNHGDGLSSSSADELVSFTSIASATTTNDNNNIEASLVTADDSLDAFIVTTNNRNDSMYHSFGNLSISLTAEEENALNAMNKSDDSLSHLNGGVLMLETSTGANSSNYNPSDTTLNNINNDLPANVVGNRSLLPNESELGEVQASSSGLDDLNFPDIKSEARLPDEEDVGAIDNIFGLEEDSINVTNQSYEKMNESDDDILIHRGDLIPPPINDGRVRYEMKTNDVVSGNIPYAPAGGDRYYTVGTNQEFKHICLTERVVQGLTQFNSGGFIDSSTYDMKFIKVLLIACFGRQKIASGEFDESSMNFIKELFTIRKKDDIGDFAKIVDDAVRHMNNNNFN